MLIVIFIQDSLNLHHIFSDHVSPDITFQEYQEMYGQCWNNEYGFIVVDKDRDLVNCRFRKGFDNFIYREKEIKKKYMLVIELKINFFATTKHFTSEKYV